MKPLSLLRSYITGDARGALGGLEGDVLHGEFVSLSPQSVPGLSVLDLQQRDKTIIDLRMKQMFTV